MVVVVAVFDSPSLSTHPHTHSLTHTLSLSFSRFGCVSLSHFSVCRFLLRCHVAMSRLFLGYRAIGHVADDVPCTIQVCGHDVVGVDDMDNDNVDVDDHVGETAR